MRYEEGAGCHKTGCKSNFCAKKSGKNPISKEFEQICAISDQLGILDLIGIEYIMDPKN